METYDILNFAIVVLAAGITYFLIPAIKSKKTNEDLKTVMNKVDIAVKAAEQIFDYQDNEKKYKYVDDILKNTFKDLTVSDRQSLIEKTVNELKSARNQLLEWLEGRLIPALFFIEKLSKKCWQDITLVLYFIYSKR